MSKIDSKVLSWMMIGSVEMNFISREIDQKLLREALMPGFKDIYDILATYFLKHKTPPTFDIIIELNDDTDLSPIILKIQAQICNKKEIGHYIEKLKTRYNKYLAKQLATLAKSAETSASFDSEEFNKNMTKISTKIDRLNRKAIFAEGSTGESVRERFAAYEYSALNPGKIEGIKTWYKELDDYLFGIKKSELLTIVGASSSGKSMFMLNIGVNAWLGSNNPCKFSGDIASIAKDGVNVLYFSMEMSKPQLEKRVDACATGIPQRGIVRGELTQEESNKWKRSLNFQSVYGKKFYIVDLPRGTKTIDIEAKIDALEAEFEIDLVIVDYLQLMAPNKDGQADWLNVGLVAEDLHELCRSKNLPVITAAQKKAKDRKTKKDENSVEGAGRSKLIGDNSNIMFSIENREDESLFSDFSFFIVKNRDGPKGQIHLKKEFHLSRISDMPEGWVLDEGDENDFKINDES